MNRLRYKLRYWYRRIVAEVGYCPDCWSMLNYTVRGRGICPECGKAK